MIKNIKEILNNKKGTTLLELLISIIVSSFVIIMLMQVLTLSVKAKAQLDYENRMLNESY